VGRWLDAVSVRHSRRAYDGVALGSSALDVLRFVCDELRPWPDARAELVAEPRVDVFRGLLGSYGKIHGAPSVLVFVASDPGDGPALRHLGYIGEGVVLEATALGLGTCWVSGFFDPVKARRLVTLAPGERVVAVSPVGHPVDQRTGTERVMEGVASSHDRKPLDEIAPRREEWPAWAQAAVAAARLAPSATNRQPWRFTYDGHDLLLCRNSRRDLPRTSKWLDLGIASMHIELAARSRGVPGSWVDAPATTSGPELCRYRPEVSGSMRNVTIR
jgi:Putative TM nitroreductase